MLESERKLEQEFVATARKNESAPTGWPAALVMFHMGMWRERLRNALADLSDGRDYERPPTNIDEFNEAELAQGIGTPLTDAAARSDHLLVEIIDLYEKVGERPMEWFVSKNTTEAVLRNSYTHPRLHMSGYFRENGRLDLANQLWEKAASEMRSAKAPPIVTGAVLYNLACVRAQEGRGDESIELLREAVELRQEIKQIALGDEDFAGLRDDPRFQELVKP